MYTYIVTFGRSPSLLQKDHSKNGTIKGISLFLCLDLEIRENMREVKEGDVVTLKSETAVKMTVTALLINDRLEATFWNPSKGEFQTVVGSRDAFQIVNE